MVAVALTTQTALLRWCIPACWIVSIGWLVRTDVVPQWVQMHAPSPPPAAATLSVIRDEWWGIYHQATKIGYAHQRWIPRGHRDAPAVAGGAAGLTLTSVTELELPVQGTMRSVNIAGAVLLNDQHRVIGLSATIASGPQVLVVTGTPGAQGGLEISIETGGRRTAALTLPTEVQLPELLTAPWMLANAQAGMRWAKEVFDPLMQQRQTAVVDVLQEARPSVVERQWTSGPVLVVRTTMGDLVSTSRVTRDGCVLREETPLGFIMVRETPETARLIHRRMNVARSDLAVQLAVPTNLRLVDPRGTRTLTVRLTGVGRTAAGLQLRSSRQRWVPQDGGAGVLTMTQETLEHLTTSRLPVQDPAAAQWLPPSPLVQSDDPEIRAQARDIIGQTTDAWEAAIRIHRWVAKTLQKTPSVGIPSAVEVLHTKQGDCNEHTALFTALARSVGIPTQICAGLVYYRNAFYYHAWPRVFVGQWVAMDPTLDQTVADATHIQLIEGELSQQVRILGLLGRLRIEGVNE